MAKNKKYPAYRVKTLMPVTLVNWAGQSFNIPTSSIGTFQARYDPAASISTINPNEPAPIIIDAIFNGQKITFRPKYYVPNGDIKPLLLSSSNEFQLLPVDKLVAIKEISMSSIDGSGESKSEVSMVSKTSTSRYIKQSYFVGAFAIVGALNGFMAAKKNKASVSSIILTTLFYSATEALGAWAIASIVNEKK